MCPTDTADGQLGEGEDRMQGDQTTDPHLPDCHITSSAGPSFTFHGVSGGGLPLSVPVVMSVRVERDVANTSTSLKRNITGVGIKLRTYDGTMCLETFY